jgi:hypothetical protein
VSLVSVMTRNPAQTDETGEGIAVDEIVKTADFARLL